MVHSAILLSPRANLRMGVTLHSLRIRWQSSLMLRRFRHHVFWKLDHVVNMTTLVLPGLSTLSLSTKDKIPSFLESSTHRLQQVQNLVEVSEDL